MTGQMAENCYRSSAPLIIESHALPVKKNLKKLGNKLDKIFEANFAVWTSSTEHFILARLPAF